MLTFANIHISDRSMFFCSGKRGLIMFDVMSSVDHRVFFVSLFTYRLKKDKTLNPEKESKYP